MSILMGMLMSLGLVAISSGTAHADTVPVLQYPAVTVGNYYGDIVTSPTGEVTVGCSTSGSGQDLVTYNSSGAVVRQISRTSQIDGYANCIQNPVVDKNGDIYGKPNGGSTGTGPNLLAYHANTLKWKYPAACGTTPVQVAVGADGNIYTLVKVSGVVHLIGLSPEAAAGQTTPTTVLDVTVASGICNMTVSSYKDGVVLSGNTSTTDVYSYAGVLVSQVAGSALDDKVNANGRLFRPTYTQGTILSASVSAYNPGSGVSAWTTQVSTSGANVSGGVDLKPLPGGGVTAVVYEQKMSGGVPVVPSEYNFTLVTLNANGQKLWAKSLLKTNAQGDSYGGASAITADTTNHIVVRRQLAHIGGSPLVSRPQVTISVLDAATGNETYNGMISGLMDAANKTGYTVDSADIRQHTTSVDTVFITSQCLGTCADTNVKLYPVKVTGLGLNYPQGAVLGVPTLKPYVAMGDSYSSGQGAGVYDTSTVTSTNKCYKSYNSYGRILGRDLTSPLTLTSFAACGGSVTSDIKTTGTYSGVSPQDTALSSTTTKVVTISIGGNDIGFANVITTCADPTKDCDGAFNAATNLLGPIFDNKLQTVYLDILQKAPLAQVYILGYPPLLAPGSSGCMVGNNGSSAPIYSAARVQKAVTLSGNLNTSIKTNVDVIRALGVNYQRLHFVDATISGSPFIGHDVCSSDPYVNGLTLLPGDTAESFHPNAKGQKAYADLLAAAMTP
ncbi:SGNH/GDSL hydrolase family protein [Streptomyces sp. NPDC060002]|uniref:SGNH/GDSL hydrolase family protein n=1 Tax=Streptomyces sp. NPDC060002 TaxID=3347033 RepID=UPI003699D895